MVSSQRQRLPYCVDPATCVRHVHIHVCVENPFHLNTLSASPFNEWVMKMNRKSSPAGACLMVMFDFKEPR